MVPAILTTRKGMQIKVDAKTVLASPLDCLEEIPEQKGGLLKKVSNGSR